MATYTKETALYDTAAIAGDIEEAGTKATNYLAADSSGIMVYDGSNGAQTPSNPSADTRNVFIDADSVDVRKGSTTLASFGTETVIKTTNGTELAHFGYAEGTGESGMTVAPYYTLGVRKKTTTAYDSTATYSVGDICVYNQRIYVCNTDITSPESWTSSHWAFYIGSHSYAEGYNTIASGLSSHAEGHGTVALDLSSHAEGYSASALEAYSHAEGSGTVASGMVSHAEGSGAVASGYSSHAEGNDTVASGDVSHAEGSETVASGMASHAQNFGTIASKPGQTAIGSYNIEDTATAAIDHKLFIIGNGSGDDDRSNAFTVDRRGRIECGDSNGVLKSIFDIFYPVGSYYDTSNLYFDPNYSLGGTWSSEEIVDDEIVEQGTNSIWTYRKWKSGIAECWGRRDITISLNNNYGGAYYGTDAVGFPTNLFNAEPTVSVSRQGRQGTGLVHISPYSVSSTQIQYFITNTNGRYDSAPIGIAINARGLWKTYSAPSKKYRWHRTA